MTVDVYQPTAEDPLDLEELALYRLIMDYRVSLGLAEIPLSRGLTATAGRHVVDTRENIWATGMVLPEGANLHSWSDAPYYGDHSQPQVMWDAPQRIGTGYTGNGYEISAAGYASIAAALAGWQGSPGHNAVIAQTGGWAGQPFLAIGIGVETAPGAGPYGGRVYHVWFGHEADPTGVPDIEGTAAGDRIAGTRFGDRLLGLDGADELLGGDGADTLAGGAGADTLDGGAETDSLNGGPGDDRYLLGAGADQVVELAGGGHDLVVATVSVTLAAEVEDVTLAGVLAIHAFGKVLGNAMSGNGAANRLAGRGGDDTLLGGGGADTLDGGLGTDSLVGGAGDDVYLVNVAVDRVVEQAGGGLDRVVATVSLNLAVEVENLVLGGVAALNANGNALTNAMTGNGAANLLNGAQGHDTLDGGGGADTLVGGLGVDSLAGGDGADHFRFAAPNLGFDRIADFAVEDVIEVSRAGFGGALALGALGAGQFSGSGFAVGAVAQFTYTPASGFLRWDADGAGGAAAVVIAVLPGAPALTAADIVVIA
jgi:Ca2+-binding RTX toxin-like protein